MTKRLQVFLAHAIQALRRRGPMADIGRKLATVREAAKHSYPTADIGDMLAEIARGYGSTIAVDERGK